EVWRFTPRRKAFYQLVSGDRALPEYVCPPRAASLPEIPAGHWCAWRGSIYYRTLPGRSQTQNDPPLAFAAEEVGITLLDVEDAVIHNLELRHFRLDGVNAHDRCKRVILDSVRLIENGRAGLAVGGSSTVGIKDSTVEGNRLVSILNAEVAQTEVLTSQLGPAGILAPDRGPIRITGGHVLVDNEEVFEPAK
ncbi:MAG: right-handed parallel beta-helix repeat-containing protein, partial [Deltaproteobacteria bacterium]